MAAELLSASYSFLASEEKLFKGNFLDLMRKAAALELEKIGGIKPFDYHVEELPFGGRVMVASEAHGSVLRTGAQRAIVKAKARNRK